MIRLGNKKRRIRNLKFDKIFIRYMIKCFGCVKSIGKTITPRRKLEMKFKGKSPVG
jgi:hypothetical protein